MGVHVLESFRLRAAPVGRVVVLEVSGLAQAAMCRPASAGACRKPAPGLIVRAAARLGVEPERCAVVGDIGADVEAARAAGARGVLVPTGRTRREEIAAATEIAPDLAGAVRLLLDGAA